MATERITTEIPTNSGSNGSENIDFANLGPYILTKFVQVLEAALIIIVGLFAIRYLKRYLSRLVTEHEQQKTAINLFEKLTTGFIIVISITLALRTVGIDMTLLVSVTILGLSYGLQDIIKNYVAGILIMFKSPFKIGDTIEIKGHTGKIDKIDFNSTTLRTFDQKDVTIYNNDVMTQSIVNFSRSSIKRIDINITLGYGSDFLLGFKIFDQILKNHPNILKKPAHKIIFQNFNDNGVTFSIRAWVEFPSNLMAIKSDLAIQLSQVFDEKNIHIPFSRSVETDSSSYGISESYQKRIDKNQQNPLFQPDQNPLLPSAGELIDFDEVN